MQDGNEDLAFPSLLSSLAFSCGDDENTKKREKRGKWTDGAQNKLENVRVRVDLEKYCIELMCVLLYLTYSWDVILPLFFHLTILIFPN